MKNKNESVEIELEEEVKAEIFEEEAENTENEAVSDTSESEKSEASNDEASNDEVKDKSADDSTEAKAEPEVKVIESNLDYQERYVRVLADLENYKKQTEKDFSQIRNRSISTFFERLLPALDNFSRALDFPAANKEVENFLVGMKMVKDQIFQVIEEAGISSRSALGEKFDPDKHEAVEITWDEEKEEGIIIKEIQSGYWIGDQLIRTAKVVVNQKSN